GGAEEVLRLGVAGDLQRTEPERGAGVARRDTHPAGNEPDEDHRPQAAVRHAQPPAATQVPVANDSISRSHAWLELDSARPQWDGVTCGTLSPLQAGRSVGTSAAGLRRVVGNSLRRRRSWCWPPPPSLGYGPIWA